MLGKRRWSKAPLHILVIGLLLMIPFSINSSLRVISPVVPFIYIAFFLMLERRRLT